MLMVIVELQGMVSENRSMFDFNQVTYDSIYMLNFPLQMINNHPLTFSWTQDI